MWHELWGMLDGSERIETTDDIETVIIHYQDGSRAILVWKVLGWVFIDSPPYDAATSTGMYDR